MSEKKVSMFPVTKEICAVARFNYLLRGNILSEILAPDFLKLGGKDISSVDGGTATDIKIVDYDKKALKNCDVLYVDYDENLNNLDIYREVIDDAKMLGSELLLSDELACLLYPMRIDESQTNVKPTILECLYDITIPVITVFTQGARTDQFAVELALRNYFLQEGYHISQIGSQIISHFFGFAALSSYISQTKDTYEKILSFNHAVKDIIEKEKSELLILGVAEPLLKYNNQIPQSMGILPFIVANAVRSDISILCSYLAPYKKQFFSEMKKHGKYRLDGPIEFFNISNTSLFVEPVTSKFEYIDLDTDFVLKTMGNDIENGEYCLFNVLNAESFSEACKAIHGTLTNNVRSV